MEELGRTAHLNNAKVLEVGAGSGATSIRLAQEGAKPVCLDYSDKAISLIIENARHAEVSLTAIQADAHHLPFANNTFDICFHQGVLEHFHAPEKLLQEQYRILKNKGIILIDVPQKYSYYTLKKRIKMVHGTWFTGQETEYSLSELVTLVSRIGFKVVNRFGRYHFRNLDRVQRHFFKRILLPSKLENIYYRTICRIENSLVGCYTAFSIGIIAQKNSAS